MTVQPEFQSMPGRHRSRLESTGVVRTVDVDRRMCRTAEAGWKPCPQTKTIACDEDQWMPVWVFGSKKACHAVVMPRAESSPRPQQSTSNRPRRPRCAVRLLKLVANRHPMVVQLPATFRRGPAQWFEPERVFRDIESH